MTQSLDVQAVQQFLRRFAEDRDWEQFHTPKNLTMALSGEVGELTEIFQWLTPAQSLFVMKDSKRASQVRDELADILQYVIRLADILEVDLNDALWDKLHRNEEKYPRHLSKGRAKKYTDLE